MTTVGYGDVFPMSNHERFVCDFLMVAGVTVFGYCICSVTIALAQGSPRHAAKLEKQMMMHEFTQGEKLSKQLTRAVHSQLSYVIEQDEQVRAGRPRGSSCGRGAV